LGLYFNTSYCKMMCALSVIKDCMFVCWMNLNVAELFKKSEKLWYRSQQDLGDIFNETAP